MKRPIHIYFDLDYSLYVTDSPGNPDKAPKQLKNPSRRVLRLVDQDGNGIFDQSTVFADREPFPEGHRPRVGGEQTIAKIIYWEYPEGGRVFHAESIATAWTMSHDEALSNLARNVLHDFKVAPKK